MFLYHTKKFVLEQKEIGFNHTITDDEYGTPSKWTLLTGWLVKNAPPLRVTVKMIGAINQNLHVIIIIPYSCCNWYDQELFHLVA